MGKSSGQTEWTVFRLPRRPGVMRTSELFQETDSREDAMVEPHQKKSGTWVGIAAIVAAAVVAVGAFVWVRRAPPPAPAPEPVAQQAPAAPADAKLPTAEETDARIRAEAAKLSARPELAEWLKQPGLLERWVVVTDNLSEGVSPRKQLGFLSPAKGFRRSTSAARRSSIRVATLATTRSRTWSPRSTRRGSRRWSATCTRCCRAPTTRSGTRTAASTPPPRRPCSGSSPRPWWRIQSS